MKFAPAIERSASGNSGLILFAEADKYDALLLKRAFESAGVTATLRFVRSGDEVIAYLESRPPYDDTSAHPVPDLLVMDLERPEELGFGVFNWLRQHPAFHGLPVVILTGPVESEDAGYIESLGADFCLEKPVDPEHLAVLAGTIESYRRALRAQIPEPRAAELDRSAVAA